MGSNPSHTAAASTDAPISQDCELLMNASREAAEIGGLIFTGADRGALHERIEDLAQYLEMIASWGRDLKGILTLRPLWSVEVEVTLKDAPSMLRQLLQAA